MTSRVASLLVLWIALSPQSRDETARPPVGPGTIAGVVVTDGSSPQPVRRAQVTLSDASGVAAAASTDDSGRFAFTSLPVGAYVLSAIKLPLVDASFASAGPRQPGLSVTITETKPIVNVTIALTRGAVITGTVRDQDGQPVQGALVTGSVVIAGPAGVRTAVARTATTDDLGRYRLYPLSPGSFVVDATLPGLNAAPSDSVRAMQPGEVQRTIEEARTGAALADDSSRRDRGTTGIWPRIFYPGTPDRAAAVPVPVGAGDERSGIDLQLQLTATHRIEGVVTMPYGAPAAGVRVTATPAGATTGRVSDDRSARTDRVGRYTISGLVPGTYDLVALNASASPSAGQLSIRTAARGESEAGEPSLWVTSQVVIGNQDVTLPLNLQRGVSVSGQLVFEGAEPGVLEVSRQRVLIRNTAFVSPPAIQAEPTGKFRLVGVVPGKYVVAYGGSPSGRSRWLRAATADGVDVLETPMDVRPGQDVQALVLTLTDHPSRLTGTLRGVAGELISRYTVVVFPAERARRAGSVRVQQLRVADTGAFETTNLPDGDYFVAAVLDAEPDWQSAPVLERLVVTAAQVTIVSGKDAVCELRVGG